MKFPYDKLAAACSVFLVKAAIEFDDSPLDQNQFEEAKEIIQDYIYDLQSWEAIAPREKHDKKRLNDVIKALRTQEGQLAFEGLFYEAINKDYSASKEEAARWKSNVLFKVKKLVPHLNSDNLQMYFRYNNSRIDYDHQIGLGRFLTDKEIDMNKRKEEELETLELAKEFGVEDKLEQGLKN